MCCVCGSFYIAIKKLKALLSVTYMPTYMTMYHSILELCLLVGWEGLSNLIIKHKNR